LSEARVKRQEAEQKKREANIARDAARRKQREEELYDEKAEQASKHAETLRRNREFCLERIAGYHRHIDNCTREMSKLLLDKIKKIIHVKKSQGKYGRRNNTGSAQTIGAILCIW